MPNRTKLIRWAIATAVLLVVVFAWQHATRPAAAGKSATFAARRGPLEINVLQGGAVEALESQAVKCEVRGYPGVKILKIVEEGYQVTDEDVKTNRVLVELDSSDLKKQITQQEITFESTAATLTDARQAYDIQLNQNISDVSAAWQKARFARMDFDKFMGATATREIITKLGLPDELDATIPTAPPKPSLEPAGATNTTATNASAASAISALPPAEQPRRFNIDFAKYADPELLGDGEAKQKIRKLEDELKLALKDYSQTKGKLEGSQRLHAKGFMTKSELELDEYWHDSSRLKVASAETAQALFLKYEFPKSCEESLSKFAEAVRELDRARKGAVSKLAQAEAKWKSAEGRYNLEVRQRKDLLEQLDKCTIRAKRTGLVVYGAGNMEQYYFGGQEQVREGAVVREQQPILTIPDMTKMAVKVRIHETYIKKVQKGLKVRITIEAFPDKKLEGEVSKVGVLPDSRNMWMNPDMKLYVTTITINGIHDWLKPGMSTKVEILVKTLPDVVYVPIQAVTPVEGKHFCLVDKGSPQERREVEVGEFNDEFIEIKHGLSEGEKVVLRAPEASEKEAAKDKENAQPDTKEADKPQPPKK
ncbi:MAG: HlyD family efflux transporter periplasmic adaptor subunit [Verrucomicrobia bacterium]|nr:HlyD family efflux transporter periplasmic adaptor subunit [Verrucomicrobiota bacterium]